MLHIDIAYANWTVENMSESWVIVLGSGRVPAELSGELGNLPSGQPPVGGVPAIMSLLSGAPKAFITVVLDPADLQLGRLVSTHFPLVNVLYQSPQGGVGAAFLAAYDAVVKTFGGVSEHPVAGYITYADTITNFPAESDVISVYPTSERRWSTVGRVDGRLHVVEKNTTSPASLALVGMFHFSDLGAFAECVRESDRFVELDIFHQGLIKYDSMITSLALEHVHRWLDVGHLDTYHDARRRVLVTRFFNHVRVREDSPEIIVKTGLNFEKIKQEADWFRALPVESRWLAPRLICSDYRSYELEYIPGLLVAESYLFGYHDDAYWSRLLKTLYRTLQTLHSDSTTWESGIALAARKNIWVSKTRERLQTSLTDHPHLRDELVVNGVAISGIESVLDEMLFVVEKSRLLNSRAVTRIHGDFHPGNMLYDHRTGVLKLVDPRGSFSVPGPFGDPIYDLAKLAHGFLGNYDAILFGCYQLNRLDGNKFDFIIPGTGPEMFQSMFRDWLIAIAKNSPYDVEIEDLDLAVALLFLSLASLHRDTSERQEVFLLHGLWLWSQARKPFIQ
jgi:dTDP-glucose pyrophosphorylase/thiamine kinase-like enzyme